MSTKALDDHIMVLNYTINGDSFVPGKPRVWSEKQICMPGNTSLPLAPDGKRVVVRPETGGPEKGSVHITMLLNFIDELKWRVPPGSNTLFRFGLQSSFPEAGCIKECPYDQNHHLLTVPSATW